MMCTDMGDVAERTTVLKLRTHACVIRRVSLDQFRPALDAGDRAWYPPMLEGDRD